MPTVPTYNNLQSSVGGAPNVNFQPSTIQGGGLRAPQGPTAGEVEGQQASAFGRAATSAGDAFGKIFNDMTQQVDQVRVIDATNKAKERMFDLTYNKDTGYSMPNPHRQGALGH